MAAAKYLEDVTLANNEGNLYACVREKQKGVWRNIGMEYR
jgi:hypothetical protein